MKTVVGRRQLDADDGPLLVAVGVFDGLHRGHAYLLEHLVREANARQARPTVVTFDAHPDAILLGHAPPLLMDPIERLEHLAALGVELVVVEHFDESLRQTPYDAFLHGITARCSLAGFLMTPDAAFGHDRGGTPTTLSDLGARDGFGVVVIPPFALDGREVRSSEIRTAISDGDLAGAERLLGRPYAIVGNVDESGRMTFPMPVALPPAGVYEGDSTWSPARISIQSDGRVELAARDVGPSGRASQPTGRSAGRLRVTLTTKAR